VGCSAKQPLWQSPDAYDKAFSAEDDVSAIRSEGDIEDWSFVTGEGAEFLAGE
jgi:hypothetical protein